MSLEKVVGMAVAVFFTGLIIALTVFVTIYFCEKKEQPTPDSTPISVALTPGKAVEKQDVTKSSTDEKVAVEKQGHVEEMNKLEGSEKNNVEKTCSEEIQNKLKELEEKIQKQEEKLSSQVLTPKIKIPDYEVKERENVAVEMFRHLDEENGNVLKKTLEKMNSGGVSGDELKIYRANTIERNKESFMNNFANTAHYASQKGVWVKDHVIVGYTYYGNPTWMMIKQYRIYPDPPLN